MLVAKYIAAGFLKDAENLLKDFIKGGSIEFSSFCVAWKRHNFSFIFMGRSDEKELREFINEMYQLTLNQMLPLSTDFQIGALYILYALFRNQEIINPVRIRITLIQFRVIVHVWDYAQRKEIRSLQYVVEYLCANCLEFVACSSLFGPCGTKTKSECSSKAKLDCSILADLKLNMSTFYENNVLSDLKSLFKQYLEIKEKIIPCKDIAADILQEYDRLNNSLESLLGLDRNNPCKSEAVDTIGSRRIEIKSASFRKKAKYYRGVTDEDVAEDLPKAVPPPIKKVKRRKRVPPELRKIGRPKKKVYTTEESECEETPQPTPTKSTKKGPVGRRTVSYLRQYEGPIVLEQPKVKIVVNDSAEESSGDVRF